MVQHSPRIVLFDLETLPNLPEALKVWPGLSSFPGKTFKAQINSVICFGYKILGEDEANCICAWDFEPWERDINDDSMILQAAHTLLKDADCVVTHNGVQFDWKFLQTRLLLKGFETLPPIKHVDTKQIASRNFTFANNRLDNITRTLFGDKKLDHEGWDLWVRTHARDTEAQAIMREYCKHDVELLEGTYKRFRPVATGIPNHNLFLQGGSRSVCPSCGSTRLIQNGWRTTATMRYQRLRCLDCGASSRTDAKGENPR